MFGHQDPVKPRHRAVNHGEPDPVAWGEAPSKPQGGMLLHISRVDWQTRLVATMLALGVVTAHVSDQGGITQLTDPAWIGWSYRLIEIGGLATALVILLLGRWRPVWAAAVLLGAGPLLAYVTSRTVGLPGDTGDIGNWGDWVGTMSLFFEASLVVVAANTLLNRNHVRAESASALLSAIARPTRSRARESVR
jgi:hypothetical protein